MAECTLKGMSDSCSCWNPEIREKKKAEDVFDKMARAWGAPLVARTKIEEFSGGILKPRTMANVDSMGCGIQGAIRVGKLVCYPVEQVAQFLRERAQMGK